MRTLFIAAILTFCSSTAFANQCDVEMHGDMQLENDILQITLDDQTIVKINQDHILFIDGKNISVNAEQQKWVSRYYQDIQQAVPEAAQVATEAVTLASSALNEVFTELLGAGNSALNNITQKLQTLKEGVKYNFYAHDGSIHLNSNSFKDGEIFSREWGQEFEKAIEELVSESIGSLMIAIGTEIIMGGGDTQAFETKMERFGQQMEHKMEYQSVALQTKANQLCSTLLSIDLAETQLQTHIKQLSNLDLLHIDKNQNAM